MIMLDWKETITLHFHLSSKYIPSLSLIFTFMLTNDDLSVANFKQIKHQIVVTLSPSLVIPIGILAPIS